jgi:hypothetical protein
MGHRVSFLDNTRAILQGWQIMQMENGPLLPSFDPKARKRRRRPSETGVALMESAVRLSTEKSSFRSRRCLALLKPLGARPCRKKVYFQDWQRIQFRKHTPGSEDKGLQRLDA